MQTVLPITKHLLKNLTEEALLFVSNSTHVRSLHPDHKEMLEYNLRVLTALSQTDVFNFQFTDALFGTIDRFQYVRARVQFDQVIKVIDWILAEIKHTITRDSRLMRILVNKAVNSALISISYSDTVVSTAQLCSLKEYSLTLCRNISDISDLAYVYLLAEGV